MCNHINNVRDSVLMQYIKQGNQIPRILNEYLSITWVPLDYKPEYYDDSTFEKDGIVYGLTCGVGSDMLVVIIENQYDWTSELVPKMIIAAGRAWASHGGYLKPVFIVLENDENDEHTFGKDGVSVENPYNGDPNDFAMKIYRIAIRSYSDPDWHSYWFFRPLWHYSDFISLVHKKMNTSPFPKAEQAICEAIDSDENMAWFFQQKPERIAQLAEEMDYSDD